MRKKLILLTLLIAGIAVFLAGCNINIGGNSVRGTGNMVTRDIDVSSFTAIDISGNYIVTFRQAPQTALTVVMQENLFDHLEVDTTGNTLQVGSRRGFDTTTNNRPRLYVYAPNLAAAEFSGAVNATGWDLVEGQSFSVEISGAANLDVDLAVEELNINISGAGNLTLRGTAGTIDVDGSGAFNISAGDLEIGGGRVDISGAANVTLSTLENVSVSSSGIARVRAAD